MKKFFALLTVLVAMYVSGCAKKEAPPANPPATPDKPAEEPAK